MKIICPDHKGVVEVTGAPYISVKNVLIEDLVIECPVCEDEVMITGRFDYDESGQPSKIKQ
ncbi:hypothetical protein [Daejeonella lutea]|uniref:Cysteine-rich CPXCG n=1 Tax=Daejeonella lutea TaxID=572036 RepID=A0A1T5EHQ6_9SPHI|nr:hypothetical protein [Daejeonella lutea]SKB83369.1 hypothetical protein SAMN05661099_3016 [Daejeonella lutea]